MPGTGVGLFVIDFIVRPFAKIWEKDPMIALLLCLCLYAVVAYFVVKSVYMSGENQNQPY